MALATSTKPQLPTLPQGTSYTLSALSESFSFHSSPENFITSRVLALHASNPNLAQSRTPIRAKILNRNVAIVSSYPHIQYLLCDKTMTEALSAEKAYNDLMAPFFPPPNLLLSDGDEHKNMKKRWIENTKPLLEHSRPMIQNITLDYFAGFTSGSSLGIYEAMKELSWRILLQIFLQASEEEADEIQQLQEDLLRGQFSLFPVSINAGMWRSPRAKGKGASKKRYSLLSSRLNNSSKRGCPFAASAQTSDEDIEEVASHLLLFSSSLAVKSLASLLTALILNLYIHIPPNATAPISSTITTLKDSAFSMNVLDSIIQETERLSPPVIGIMRRTTQDIPLPSSNTNTPDTLIPKGWDIWMYFARAARDPAIFGPNADTFSPNDPEHQQQSGLPFGLGPKSCLGAALIREIVSVVVETCLGSQVQEGKGPRIKFQGNQAAGPRGVQGWLGWQSRVTPEEWAKDMKQLPTQRPAKAVMTIVHELDHREV